MWFFPRSRFLSFPFLFAIPILALIASLGIAGCEKKKSSEAKENSALSSVVSGFSGGSLSAEGPLRVTLVNAQIDTNGIHKVLENNPFEVTPAVKGSAVWIDERTLEFRPAEKFERGRKYSVVLHLDKIMEIPEKLKRFEFEFSAMAQFFERELGGLEMVDERALKWQRFRGLIRLADGEEGAQVEAALAAFQNGKPAAVTWEHRADRREHLFVIDSLSRVEQAVN